MKIRDQKIRRRAAFVTLFSVCCAGALSTGAAAQAPRRPPQPFTVFVHPSDPDDASLQDALEEATREVQDRVRGRRNWFRLADSAEAADITLRIINYRTAQLMIPKLEKLILRGQVQMVERSEMIEFHYVDAVALSGGVRGNLTGLDERENGPSLRNAAGHLAEELERFCKDNYAALTGSE